MNKTVRCFTALIILLLVAGCGAPQARPSLHPNLKAATARATGCPGSEITISNHRPRLKSWTASGCQRTYRCVGMSLDVELADCSATTVARRPR